MNKKFLGKILRFLVGIYFLFLGFFSLIKDLISIYSAKDDFLFLANVAVVTTDIAWGFLFLAMALTIFQNKSHYFLTIISILIIWGISAFILSYTGFANKNISFPLIFVTYIIPAIFLIISKFLEPKKEEDSVQRARKILGENIENLSDEQLKKYLKN